MWCGCYVVYGNRWVDECHEIIEVWLGYLVMGMGAGREGKDLH